MFGCSFVSEGFITVCIFSFHVDGPRTGGFISGGAGGGGELLIRSSQIKVLN